jgi:hypothetical protein
MNGQTKTTEGELPTQVKPTRKRARTRRGRQGSMSRREVGALNNCYWAVDKEVRERRICFRRLWTLIRDVERLREQGRVLPEWASQKRYQQLTRVCDKRLTKLLGDLQCLGKAGFKLPKWAFKMVPSSEEL